MGGGGQQSGSSTTVQRAEIPQELQPLYSSTSSRIVDAQNTMPITGYAQPQPMEIAPMNPFQTAGLSGISYLGQRPAEANAAYLYALAAPFAGGMMPDTSNLQALGVQLPGVLNAANVQAPTQISPEQYASIMQSPGYLATKTAFEQGTAPTIENQMALSGLGRSSSLADALSLGWSQMAPGAIESEFGRMERGIERELAAQQWNEANRMAAEQYNLSQMLGVDQWNEAQRLAAEQHIAGLGENAITRQTQALGAMAPALASMAASETGRRQLEQLSYMTGGDVYRDIEQAVNTAAYQDFLRRQELATNALYAPMGLLSSATQPSMYSTTETTTSGGGGGLFK